MIQSPQNGGDYMNTFDKALDIATKITVARLTNISSEVVNGDGKHEAEFFKAIYTTVKEIIDEEI